MKSTSSFAKISNLSVITGNIFKVELTLENASAFTYRPGQYVDMYLNDEKCRTFSIASSPESGETLEFHLRDVEDGLLEQLLLTHYNERFAISLIGPKGDYRLNLDSPRPLIMLAGGTGFAPIKSLLESAFKCTVNRSVTLYWGARSQDELYFEDSVQQWADEYDWFNYVPVLSDQSWDGRMGYVHEAVLEDIADLSNHEVYASGAPLMIKASYEAFIHHGLVETNYYSDILDYAKTL